MLSLQYQPETFLTSSAKLAACKRIRARLSFDVIISSKKETVSESAIRARRQAVTSAPSAERERGPVASRSNRSTASKRLKIVAVESAASLSKHWIRVVRLSPFPWTSDTTVIRRPSKPGPGCRDVVNSDLIAQD